MKLGISKISRGLAATVIAGIVGLSAHTAAMAETTIRPRPTCRSTNSPPVFGNGLASAAGTSLIPDQGALSFKGSPGVLAVEIIQ